jgi:hypothetical protein
MRSFQASIEQMLWPERRDQDSNLGAKIPGKIDRTTTSSYLKVSGGYLPDALRKSLGLRQRLAPWIFGEGGIQLGPIPAGTPIGLLANLNPLSEDPDPSQQLTHAAKLLKLVATLDSDLRKLPKDASDAQGSQIFGNSVDQLLDLSKCPDLIVNRGHYFGTDFLEPGEKPGVRQPGLSDADKRALIEFLKTF